MEDVLTTHSAGLVHERVSEARFHCHLLFKVSPPFKRSAFYYLHRTCQLEVPQISYLGTFKNHPVTQGSNSQYYRRLYSVVLVTLACIGKNRAEKVEAPHLASRAVWSRSNCAGMQIRKHGSFLI